MFLLEISPKKGILSILHETAKIKGCSRFLQVGFLPVQNKVDPYMFIWYHPAGGGLQIFLISDSSVNIIRDKIILQRKKHSHCI